MPRPPKVPPPSVSVNSTQVSMTTSMVDKPGARDGVVGGFLMRGERDASREVGGHRGPVRT